MKENGPRGLRARTGELFTRMQRAGEPLWFLKTYGSPYQRPGVPDYLICYGGVFGGLELKSPGEEPTPTQVNELNKIDRAQGESGVASTLEAVEAFLDRLRVRSQLSAQKQG